MAARRVTPEQTQLHQGHGEADDVWYPDERVVDDGPVETPDAGHDDTAEYEGEGERLGGLGLEDVLHTGQRGQAVADRQRGPEQTNPEGRCLRLGLVGNVCLDQDQK